MSSLDIVRQTCSRCKEYIPSEKWELGHFYCSSHRDCTGKTGWTPEECQVCGGLIQQFASQTGGQQHSFIKQLRQMLRRTCKGRSRKNKPWVYTDKLKETFPDYFLENELSPSSPGSSIQQTQPQQSLQHQHQQQLQDHQTALGYVHTGLDHDDLVQSQEEMGTEPATVSESHSNIQYQQPTNLMQAMGEIMASFKETMGSFSNDISLKFDVLQKQNQGHQSRLEKFLASKRSRDSSSESSDESASSSRHSSIQSPSPSKSLSPVNNDTSTANTNTSSEAGRESYFIEDGHTWIWVTRETEFFGSKVKIGGTLTPYVMHSRKRAFRTVSKQAEAESPFMNIAQALETITAFLSTQHESGDKLGPSNRSFRWQLTEDSDLSHTMKILTECAPKAVDAIYREDWKALDSSFPTSAFDAVSMINITSGWTFSTDSFAKIAKADLLDLREASRQLLVPYTIYIPKKYLLEEKAARSRVFEFISAIGVLDGIIAMADDNSPLAEVLKAATRQCVSFLKDFAIAWYKAKFLVRRIALQYSTRPIAMQLLCSNVWEASLFSSKTCKEFTDNDKWSEGTKVRLGLRERTNKNYRKNNSAADPSRHLRREGSRSPQRRNYRQRQPSNYGRSSYYSDRQSPKQSNQTQRRRRGPYKKQKVSFRDQASSDKKGSGPSRKAKKSNKQ